MRAGAAGRAPAGDCSLDGAECISLQQILQAFNSTISEEHAWALFHQAARCFQRCLAEGSTCYLVLEPRHVLLHKDGTVHPNTLLRPGGHVAFKSDNCCGRKVPQQLRRNLARPPLAGRPGQGRGRSL
ncbi:Protein spire [Eumeta japonica]|uniref:Protein spire n=1 Tax=Eumeta variegata TaxID=151549 RepID=A0A4C2A1E9_EUMVA|nr:Protein spire [Eumeta japonica]